MNAPPGQHGWCDALGRWAASHLDGWSADPVVLSVLSGGSSAAVYRVVQRDRCAVLRTVQQPPRPDSLRALDREARVLRALSGTAVPCPEFLGYEPSSDVLGAPFLLTGFVEGWSGAETPPLELQGAAHERDLALALVDALASLHAIDPVAIGLERFGKPEGFLVRQVDQWCALFERHRSSTDRPSRGLPQVPILAQWLRAHLPENGDATLIHCDASFSNVMFHSEAPPRVAALIDWEIATIGDPLLDLGRAAYPFPDRRGLPGVSMMVTHSGITRQEMAARYQQRTGRSVVQLDYYMVLAMFKLAALIEPNFARDRLGEDPTGFAGHVASFVMDLLDGAIALTQLDHRTGE